MGNSHVNDGFAATIEEEASLVGSPVERRAIFFSTLRRLRSLLEAEYWLLLQGLSYDEDTYILRKQMLFDRLIHLEPTLHDSVFDAAEAEQLSETKALVQLCEKALVESQKCSKNN